MQSASVQHRLRQTEPAPELGKSGWVQSSLPEQAAAQRPDTGSQVGKSGLVQSSGQTLQVQSNNGAEGVSNRPGEPDRRSNYPGSRHNGCLILPPGGRNMRPY